jgi:hypothetical protein
MIYTFVCGNCGEQRDCRMEGAVFGETIVCICGKEMQKLAPSPFQMQRADPGIDGAIQLQPQSKAELQAKRQ